MAGGFARGKRRRLGFSFRERKDASWTWQRLEEGIGPQLKAAGLDWVDFHVMRRTHSTLMNEIHDDPKLVADQLGHTVDVNQNVYTRASIARRKTAVDALENALPVN